MRVNDKFIYKIILINTVVLFSCVYLFNFIDGSKSIVFAEDLSKIDKLYNSSFLNYNEYNYQNAIKDLNLAMEQDSFKKLAFVDKLKYLILLSRIEASLGDKQSSKNILKEIILKEKYCFDAYIILSKLYRSSNQYEASIEVLNKGLDRLLSYKDDNLKNTKEIKNINSIEKSLYNNLSLSYLYNFDDKNALFYLNKSLSISSDDEKTILMKSIYSYIQKDYDLSLKDLDSILESKADNDKTTNKKDLCFKYYLKSKILASLGRYEESLSYIKKAMELDNKNMALKLDLAILIKDKFSNIEEAYPYFYEVKNLGNTNQKKISTYYLDTMDL